VRLVGPNGEQIGVIRIEEAIRLAQENDLDLVEVAPEARPPVAKIMDYGKYKYQEALKARENRRSQVNAVVKEMKIRPRIESHDYDTKKNHIERFLLGGDKVKVTIMFRGREQSRPEMGYKLLARLAEDLAEVSVIEFAPKQDGRNMVMVLAPNRRKSDAVKAKTSNVKSASAPKSAPKTKEKEE
jgi:translation initiation factor IF-3